MELFAKTSKRIFSIAHMYESYSSIKTDANLPLGIYNTQLTSEVVVRILQSSLMDIDIDSIDIVCISMSRIERLQSNFFDNIKDYVYKILEVKKIVVFFDIDSGLVDDEFKEGLKKIKKGVFSLKKVDDMSVLGFYLDASVKEMEGHDLVNYNWHNNCQKAYDSKVVAELIDITVTNDEKRLSTPVYLDKYINIKKTIHNSNMLMILTYLLAIKLIEQGLLSNIYSDNRKIIMSSHTLNGTIIATMLSDLFSLDLSYLDHIGPINKLYRNAYEKKMNTKNEYLIVSDVICMGSEVGSVESIISYNGGSVRGYATVFSIKTNDHHYTAQKVSLFEINDTNNPIDYYITTDLCKYCKKGETK